MSKLLASVEGEYAKFYSQFEEDEQPRRLTHIEKCLEDTQEFKLQLKKLRAHLNKYINDCEEGHIEDQKKSQKKKDLIVDKINRSHKQFEHSIRKSHKLQQSALTGYHKHFLNRLTKIEIDQIYLNKLPEDAHSYVKEAIGYHICRYHMRSLPVMDSKDVLINYLESLYGISPQMSDKFIDMGEVIQNIQTQSTHRCLDWINHVSEDQIYSETISKEGLTTLKDLQFQLYILEFLKVLREGDALQSFKYITNVLPRGNFNDKANDIIQKIAPLLTKSVIGKPVADIDAILKEQVDKCVSIFTMEYCAYLNLPHHSPLFLIVLSGIISFQFFIKYKNIRSTAHVGWTTEDELPFDVKLPPFLSHFHPIFICPVLKEETTVENPPYSLACHHIISKKALDRLSKNGSLTFKCPYCPVNTSMANTRKVNFIMV